MPPWAAIEWARRGESWKVKTFTLYPSWAIEAAAEAPASPVPTTMTSNLRLLPGLTSFISNLCWSQVFSIGPVGALETSRGSGGMELMVRSSVSDDAGQDHDGEADVDDADQHGEPGG